MPCPPRPCPLPPICLQGRRGLSNQGWNRPLRSPGQGRGGLSGKAACAHVWRMCKHSMPSAPVMYVCLPLHASTCVCVYMLCMVHTCTCNMFGSMHMYVCAVRDLCEPTCPAREQSGAASIPADEHPRPGSPHRERGAPVLGAGGGRRGTAQAPRPPAPLHLQRQFDLMLLAGQKALHLPDVHWANCECLSSIFKGGALFV